jgi:small-conductance mechanosensitive channel
MPLDQALALWRPWLTSCLLLLAAVAVGLVVHLLVFRAMRRLMMRTATVFDDAFVARCRAPLRVLLPVFFVHVALPLAITDASLLVGSRQATSVAIIACLTWTLVAVTGVISDVILQGMDIQAADNLAARKAYTQIAILRRIAIVILCVLGGAALLMNFERLRQLGTGLLASAGLAGLIVGLAAQRTLANLLAGIQIALTQPIRIDDVVIVEGEWGRIEEITLTYVVVCIWDERRLIVPIGQFMEKPFQNWTRTSADILGSVFVYVDYRAPIEEIRVAVGRMIEESQFWDGRVWRLHVTDSKERTLELRALMSARDSSSAWELRCEVREKLVTWLRRNHPDALPRVRAEVTSEPVEARAQA